MWVLDYLDDLDADFRVFYQIDDMESLPGPRFFALALRVFAYQGVMAALAAAQQEQGHQNGTEVKQVEGNKADVLADPAFAGLVSWGGG
jgi:hypothetical protein